MEFKPYDPKAIEPKWQKRWADSHVFEAKNDYTMPKFYGLIEFPYPSGQGLHVGHPRSNTAMDIIARKRRMEGCNVLFPIGWDAFGLPTENYAIKNKVHPAIVTKKNIDHFREQLQKIGFSFDYSREVNTTDPSYYRWTQWIFLQLFKHGLAFPAGDPFIVYPGKNGMPEDSIRHEVFTEGLQDQRALQLLETKMPREKIMKELDKLSPDSKMSMANYPRGEKNVLAVRKKINQLIKKHFA